MRLILDHLKYRKSLFCCVSSVVLTALCSEARCRFMGITDYEINNTESYLFLLRHMRPQRLWMRLRSRLPCRFVRRTATRCPLPGRLGPSNRMSLTLQYPRGSPILFREAWREKQKWWKFTVAPRLRSPLCAALKITVWQHSPWDSVAFLPPPPPHATQRVWSPVMSEHLRRLRQRERREILCTRKAKFRWMSVQNVEARSGRSEELITTIEVCTLMHK